MKLSIDELALECGTDIPMPELQMTFHQPNWREVSFIGEQKFFIGIQSLSISSLALAQVNVGLENTPVFQIFMRIMQEQETRDKKEAVLAVLGLIFPGKQAIMTPQSILIGDGMIDENNFEIFQEYVKTIFCVNAGHGEQTTFNPADARAKEIADKLMRGRQRVAEQKGDQGSAIGKYISILSVAFKKTPNEIRELTMFQTYDLLERYSLWLNWDLDIRSRLAGGKPDSKPDDWMKNIH